MNKLLHNLGRYWFFILVGICIIWAIVDSPQPLPPPVTPPQVAVNTAPEQPAHTGPAVSLSTGTIIKSRLAYLQGDGELEIDNGTNSDALAKLITGGTSIYSVYIKANTNYTIKNITDGTYWLIFSLGNDWNSATKTFNQSTGYSSFADTFDFTTTDTEYTTYSVSLNPVEGGTAQLNDVDASRFNQY